MKISHKLIALTAVVIIVVGVTVYLQRVNDSQKKNMAPLAHTSTTSVTDVTPVSTSANEKIAVDLSICKLQQEKVYLCPAEALENFGPVTVKNTGQTNACTISYDRASGYSFKGAVKSTELPAGEFLVSTTESGGIANIVRSSASQALTFFVGGSERVVHVMIVDGKDYSRDQCLEI